METAIFLDPSYRIMRGPWGEKISLMSQNKIIQEIRRKNTILCIIYLIEKNYLFHCLHAF